MRNNDKELALSGLPASPTFSIAFGKVWKFRADWGNKIAPISPKFPVYQGAVQKELGSPLLF
jgi:hypothetical protein